MIGRGDCLSFVIKDTLSLQKWLETLAGKSVSASQRCLKTYARGAENERAVVVNHILLVQFFLGTEESLIHSLWHRIRSAI